jgi:hypothetical protein
VKVAAVEAIARALEEGQVRYLVVGGVAVVAHGYGRLTGDLDLVVELERDNVLKFFAALAPLGYRPHVPVSPEAFADAVTRKRLRAEKGMQVLSLVSDRYPDVPIDVLAEEPFDFGSAHAEALVQDVAAGVPLRIVGLRTLIRMKEDVGRARDRDDVEQLRKLLEEKDDDTTGA